MILNSDQTMRLMDDLDYIIARTRCNTIQLTRRHAVQAIERDADVFLDLIEGMPDSDARFLSLPHDALRRMIAMRRRGVQGHSADEPMALLAVSEE